MSGFLKTILVFGLIMTIFIFSTTRIIVAQKDYSIFCENGDTSRSCDAVVAISGGNTSERTAKAIDIFKQGYGKKLIFSGANSDPDTISDAAQMAKQARGSGVSTNDILMDQQAKNTYENAKNVAAIIKEQKYKTIILVTSPYHSTRAALEFKKAFMNTDVRVFSAPADNDPEWNDLWWTNTRGWYLALSELVGICRFYIGASNLNG